MSIKKWNINTTLNQYKKLRPVSQQDNNYNYDTDKETLNDKETSSEFSKEKSDEDDKNLFSNEISDNIDTTDGYVELINNQSKFFGDSLNEFHKKLFIKNF